MNEDTLRVITGIPHAECKGENGPQSPATLFKNPNSVDPLGLDRFVQVAGPKPSYNNFCDIDRLLQTMTHAVAVFDKNDMPPRAIALAAKHGNCCGGAHDNLKFYALKQMIFGDRRAIFGGVIMTNFAIEERYAEALTTYGTDGPRRLLSAVVAPAFEEAAINILRGTKDGTSLLQNAALADPAPLDTSPRFRHVRGGFIEQPNYTFVPLLSKAERSGPDINELQRSDVAFAWAIGSTSNSNTITIVKDGMLVGNGVGQQDRVGAAELAIKRARDAGHLDFERAVAYSDSFFPFADGPESLIAAGVTTIFATSGSIRDAEVQAACANKGATLLLLPDSEARGFFGH